MAPVSIRHLTKIFSSPTRVLDDISLDVADGEFLAILGPSGSGKSTILRCLAGLEEPSGGELWLGDRRIDGLAPGERDVAMVFQNYALYPHLTVRANLEFPLRMRRVPAAARRTAVNAIAELLELAPLLARMPGQLSGGQRQRVALGRALVREPALFLFDEPLSNLDATLRVQLRSELMTLHRALSATMLYVTHDQVEALTMGTRVAVMDAGRMQQVGTPAEIYGAPVNTFVARFVGSPGMNLLPAELVGRAPPGAEIAGIRPEHVVLGHAGEGVVAVVRAIERLGSETLVHLDRADGGHVSARIPGLADYAVGDELLLRFPPERVHWFEADGRRR